PCPSAIVLQARAHVATKALGTDQCQPTLREGRIRSRDTARAMGSERDAGLVAGEVVRWVGELTMAFVARHPSRIRCSSWVKC
ncbi:MAG: hypothetical protein M3Y17_06730, partial [Actinomycetota bacterium]|nr:hypothetical protein [Actinomycetota bacterium]